MSVIYRVSGNNGAAFDLTVDQALMGPKDMDRVKARLLQHNGVLCLCRGVLDKSDGDFKVVPRTKTLGFEKSIPDLLVVEALAPATHALVKALREDHIVLQEAKQRITSQHRYQDRCQDYRRRSRHHKSKHATRGFWNKANE